MSKNYYSKSFIEWYNLIMGSGLSNYVRAAKAISSRVRRKRKILELGIGTGLLAEKLVEKGYDVTGVDCSEAMLLQTKERLGSRVSLFEQDVLGLDIPGQYEAAISYGGVWYCTGKFPRLYLESHLLEEEENQEGLIRVANHLMPQGLLLIGVQDAHIKMSRFPLKDNAMYSTRVYKQGNIIHKSYYVMFNGRIAAYQHSTFRRFTKREERRLMKEAGFAERGPDTTNTFCVWQKA